MVIHSPTPVTCHLRQAITKLDMPTIRHTARPLYLLRMHTLMLTRHPNTMPPMWRRVAITRLTIIHTSNHIRIRTSNHIHMRTNNNTNNTSNHIHMCTNNHIHMRTSTHIHTHVTPTNGLQCPKVHSTWATALQQDSECITTKQAILLTILTRTPITPSHVI